MFKRISLEELLCLVGVEEVLVSPFALKPLKPEVIIGQLPVLLLNSALGSSQISDTSDGICFNLRLLHVAGPHIFNSRVGGRRWQASAAALQFDASSIFFLALGLLFLAVLLLVCNLNVAQAIQNAAANLQLVFSSHEVMPTFCCAADG